MRQLLAVTGTLVSLLAVVFGHWNVQAAGSTQPLAADLRTTSGEDGVMKFHFDCVFYYVSDMERAIRFYRDTLGFKPKSRDIVARFDIDGVLFELVPAGDKQKIRGPGNGRLCLQVENVEQALKELQRKGVRTGHAEIKDTGVLGSFEDPDGNEICLWQYLQK